MTPAPFTDPGMPIWVDMSVETSEQREALMAFYSAVHGWTWDVSGPEMGSYSLASSNGQTVFGLGEGPGGQGAMIPFFLSTDVARDVERATELGGSVAMGPMTVTDTGVMAVLLDPAQATFGLWQPQPFPGFGVVYEVGSVGWFDHVSDRGADAAAFYGSLLGKTVLEPAPGMRILANGEQWFASISDSDETFAPGWSTMYIVDNLASFRETAREHGATIVAEELPVPGTVICIIEEPVMKTRVTVMQAGEQPA